MDFINLPPLTVLDLVGRDAARVLNNLCTAPVLTLQPGEGCEAFITEVRGRTLGHLCTYRFDDRLRLIGAAGQAETIAAHVDRYTIREDATTEDLSNAWLGLLLDEDCLRELKPTWHTDPPKAPQLLAWQRLTDSGLDDPAASSESPSTAQPGAVDAVHAYRVPWLGRAWWLVAGPANAIKEIVHRLSTAGANARPESTFHQLRVQHRFPWFGDDLDDRNLPQEADRDALAISFTKGCYLGQETVARLDALGQVQKKLVLWRISGNRLPAVGTELSDGERVVGRLTSVVPDPAGDGFLALGFARRSHFDAGAVAQLPSDGGELQQASVI